MLHRFGYTGIPEYRGRPYHQFGLGCCKIHVDILVHPTDLAMTAWFTTARSDDLDDALERVALQALTEFCERHLPVLGDTAIALLPVRNEGNAVCCERVTAIGDPELLMYHAGFALTARYSQHVSSLLQEVTTTGAHLRLHLEEYVDQVKAKNRAIKDIQKGNRELLQKNTHLEMCVKELNDDLDDTRTRLQHAQNELTVAQSYVHHLETELHERDEQLKVSQAQTAELQHEIEHLLELIPEEPEELEEDPKEIEDMSGVEDN
jgi:hypothetical protein